MTDQPRVLVTGASGYIAMHCIIQLLEQGYHVRGTLRSHKKEDRLRKIFAPYISDGQQVEFAIADLTKDDGWDAAMDDCTYVLHVASPVAPDGAHTEAAFVRPAVDGTTRVMNAAVKANIKRVVQTSSVSAVYNRTALKSGKIFTEEDWENQDNPVDYYSKSKCLAERTAFQIAQLHNLEIAAINPTFVLGPIFDSNFSLSLDVILRLLRKDYPALPKLKINVVDVRDVAAAHILAMTTPEAAGHRFICNSEGYWMREIAEMLNQEFAAQNLNIGTMVMPNFVLQLIALFDDSLKGVVPTLGVDIRYDTSKIKSILDWQPRPAKQSILDAAHSLIEHDAVKI